MTLKEFINQNKDDIDKAIGRARDFVSKQASCNCPKSGTDHYHDKGSLNNEERRLWILNDEGLYMWAKSQGVNI